MLLAGSVMLLGCRESLSPNARLVSPLCENPAALLGQFDPNAPGYIVVFHDDVDAREETDRLAARYAFEPRAVWEFALRGFWADLSPEVVAALRCEASVKYMEYNQGVSIAA